MTISRGVGLASQTSGSNTYVDSPRSGRATHQDIGFAKEQEKETPIMIIKRSICIALLIASLIGCNGDDGQQPPSAGTAPTSTTPPATSVSAATEFWIEPGSGATKTPDLSEPIAIPVAGKLTDAQAQIAYGDIEPQAVGRGGTELWKNTGHVFGYLAPKNNGEIVHAGNMEPDETLKGAAIKLKLNRLRVADYPGKGLHRVLFDFYAKNQTTTGDEPVHFNQVYRAQEGQGPGIIGYPIFNGLNVGKDGLSFRGYTVNVSNDSDEKLLAVLESDVVKDGLKLATTAQPAIAPFSQMALGITKMVASRRRNVPVQDVFVGLDFSNDPSGARLAVGDYIIVQVPDTTTATWRWSDWWFDKDRGIIVDKATKTKEIPYNYFILGIVRAAQ
jgi:hypothetical protein